jgi:D-alanyl-D-alanine endopeptidase (penicillin-binding protein 7)
MLWLTLPVSAQDVPTVNASAFIVLNSQTNTLWEQNANTVRSIASLTKLMTAAVLVDAHLNPAQMVTIQTSDVFRASTTHLRARDKVTVSDLFHLMFIASDNAAARALARTATGNPKTFVNQMNAKAEELRMTNSHFSDPTGLLSTNTSTALDVAHLLMSVAGNDYYSPMLRTPSWSVRIGKRLVTVQSTNHLVRDGSVPVVAAKTGYIHQSGFCLATFATTTTGEVVTLVVLGASSNVGRFAEMRHLYDWVASRLPAPDAVVPLSARMLSQLGERVCMFPTTVSDAGQAFIKAHEQFSTKAYKDVTGYAIGYGMHRWKDRLVTRKYPGRVTAEQADMEFTRQLSYYETIVQQSVCSVLNQSAYDSLVSVAWNLGRVNTRIIIRFAVMDAVQPEDFLSTATVRGRINNLLWKRRTSEYELFVR